MISASQIQDYLKFPADKLAGALALRDEIVEQFELLTNGKWLLRTGFVQQERMQPESRVVWLRLLPAATITSVETKAVGEATWNLEDPTSYELVRGRNLRIVSGFWPELVRVTYDGGYDETTCPADIRRAILLQMEFMLARNRNGRGALASEQFENGTTTFASADMHAHFKLVVATHRRRA